MINFKDFLEEKRGLWDNIHAKRKRIKAGSGERMRKPGSKGTPTEADFKASNEEVVVEGAPIVVMPMVPRPKKAEPTKVRYQGDIVPPTQPPSTEKRGVKGRPGQRPMPTYDVEEGKKKGADGKACWKGYKYAGTKNGKDKCVPMSENVENIMDSLINKIVVNEAIHNKK